MSATVATPPEDPTVEQPRPGRRLRLVLFLLAFLVAGAAAWWFLLGPASAADVDGEVVEGEIVELEPMTTTTGTDQLHHARVGLAVVLTDRGSREAITAKEPLLQDALLGAIAERDADTLRSAEGSEALRAELSDAARDIWSEEEIARVVLVELLVQ